MRHILALLPDIIKLDISLTRNVDTDPTRYALAAALIEFARKTRGSIVAEGVETAAELETLRALGAQTAQGFFLARPQPLEHVCQLIAA
jgi:EAL domain-containing protein (putative c-di-GMP-specific phosphodiesterase class I)